MDIKEVVNVVPSERVEFSITLTMKTQTIILGATNREDLEKWITCLRKAAGLQPLPAQDQSDPSQGSSSETPSSCQSSSKVRSTVSHAPSRDGPSLGGDVPARKVYDQSLSVQQPRYQGSGILRCSTAPSSIHPSQQNDPARTPSNKAMSFSTPSWVKDRGLKTRTQSSGISVSQYDKNNNLPMKDVQQSQPPKLGVGLPRSGSELTKAVSSSTNTCPEPSHAAPQQGQPNRRGVDSLGSTIAKPVTSHSEGSYEVSSNLPTPSEPVPPQAGQPMQPGVDLPRSKGGSAVTKNFPPEPQSTVTSIYAELEQNPQNIPASDQNKTTTYLSTAKPGSSSSYVESPSLQSKLPATQVPSTFLSACKMDFGSSKPESKQNTGGFGQSSSTQLASESQNMSMQAGKSFKEPTRGSSPGKSVKALTSVYDAAKPVNRPQPWQSGTPQPQQTQPVQEESIYEEIEAPRRGATGSRHSRGTSLTQEDARWKKSRVGDGRRQFKVFGDDDQVPASDAARTPTVVDTTPHPASSAPVSAHAGDGEAIYEEIQPPKERTASGGPLKKTVSQSIQLKPRECQDTQDVKTETLESDSILPPPRGDEYAVDKIKKFLLERGVATSNSPAIQRRLQARYPAQANSGFPAFDRLALFMVKCQ